MNFYAPKRAGNLCAFHKALLVMKLIVILLTASFLQVSASSFAQKITLRERNASLEKVINSIRQQSGFDFVYNDADVRHIRSINIFLEKANLEESLRSCLDGTDLDFEIKDKTIIIRKKDKTILSTLTDFLEPTGPITGTLMDEEGNTLPGASIRTKDFKLVAVTNTDGEFKLNVEEGTSLLFSYIGYKSQEIVVTRKTKKLVITLEKVVSKLDEVAVEGYRTTSRRTATNAASRVTAEDMEKQPVQDPLQALMGRVPGLLISQSNGVPGARLSVEIRGRTNFDKNISGSQPLFIIDGVPMAAGNDKINQLSGPFGPSTANGLTAFAGINMSDIESIDVLKDADATAIYGSRGANGVIIITTKKGKAGKMTMSANIYSGFNQSSMLPQMLNTEQYLAMRNEAFTNDKLTKTNSNAYDLLLWDSNRYTDFGKLLIGKNAATTDASVNLTGGTKYAQYRIGGAYHREGTVWPGDQSTDRLATSFAYNAMSENEKFTANFTGNYSISNNNLTAVDLASAIALPPNFRLYDANGNLSWNQNGFNDGRTNPMAQLNQRYLSQLTNVTGGLVLNYKLLKNLELRTNMGYNASNTNERRITPISAQNPAASNLSGLFGTGDSQYSNWIVEPQVQFYENIGKGKLDVLLGATYNSRNTNTKTITATGGASDDLAGSLKAYTNLAAANTLVAYKYQAFFGRVNYNWEDKYIVNFTGRRDGSSRFGPNFRFSNFGAVGAAWLFTNEDALKHNRILSYGKLRASHGTTGSDQIGDYTYYDSWGSGVLYTDSTTLAATKLYNPNLRWERNTKSEVGLELGFLKDRILMSVAYYQGVVSDPLANYPLPRTTGFQNIVQNLDGVEFMNKGIEATLSTRNIQRKNFSWSTDFNITIPKNYLKRFPNLANSSYATTYAIGESLNWIYAAQSLGVDPQTGLYVDKDVNGDGVINVNDYANAGKFDPKFYGGLNNSFNYKGLSLSFFFTFTKQLGRDWRQSVGLNPPGQAYNVPTLALDRWTQPGDVTNVQKFTTSAGSLTGISGYYAGYFSNQFYTDASFIRLKNVSLSYQLPVKWAGSIGLKSARVYMLGQNLFVITPYKGADPETQSYTSMPTLRTFTAGLQITL